MIVAQHPEYLHEFLINCNLTSRGFFPSHKLGKQAHPGLVLKYSQGIIGMEGKSLNVVYQE